MVSQEQNLFDYAFTLQDDKSDHQQVLMSDKAIGSYREQLKFSQVQLSATFYSFDKSSSTETLPQLSPTPSSNDLPVQETRSTIHLPIAIPQTSNLFGVKHLSPFARCYPPALQSIQNPISQEVFVDFLDGLNGVFVAHPSMLAIGSSPMMSFLRVRKYMQKINQELFRPSGLKAKIVSTKKMISSIKSQTTDGKDRLVLCNLGEVGTTPISCDRMEYTADMHQKCEENPQDRLLRTLDGYVSPLSFDVPSQALPTNSVGKALSTSTSFIDRVQTKLLSNSRRKISNNNIGFCDQNDARIFDLEKAILKCQSQLKGRSLDLDLGTASAKEHIEIHDLRAHLTELKVEMALEKQVRDNRLEKTRIAHARTFAAIDGEDNKLANRILWLVITEDEGNSTRPGRSSGEIAKMKVTS
ncbi:hypothetical protein M438DRAFT_339268 [Aureobasidium pullulans EXF-150]|uniref:Uncharacterized protein n=1 Tax=Aureobasidium pullulans EXF-150 TaxID=1043002 RepID=A0A074X364_AURPU|nr:uncharacterized protein M438DRAFT_339268 [Aureobasidium pullulans EXF-150]KEQ79960.1 hypothetical protein M438DRAFT_339268 [Aureobasidium pullulans EXF-150]